MRNVILIKGMPMFIDNYEVTYVSDTLQGFTRKYKVNYKKRDENERVIEEFDLHPNVLYNKTFTDIAASNPSTKHYLHKDVFTHIASLPKEQIDPKFARQMEDSTNYTPHNLRIGDTLFTSKYYGVLQSIYKNPSHPDYNPGPQDLTLGVDLAVYDAETGVHHLVQPMIAVRDQLWFDFPAKINDFGLKVKLDQSAFEMAYTPEASLNYRTFKLKEGESFHFNGHEIKLVGFDRNPSHDNYEAMEGDIAVGAMLQIASDDGGRSIGRPLYLIRGKQSFNIKDEERGFHFRFTKIDPKAETFTFQVAYDGWKNNPILMSIAENVRRSDYIVLEAIVFPGINLFWLGSILMMLGTGLGWYQKSRS